MISSLNPRLSSALFSTGCSAQLQCIFRGEQHVCLFGLNIPVMCGISGGGEE